MVAFFLLYLGNYLPLFAPPGFSRKGGAPLARNH